ncbi:MAG: Holliday junction resolvase [Thermoplasmata archaeon]|nr:Holliday junction resolvase [Thermoplasmata archaeon]
MGRSSSTYERELKELLQGDPETVDRYSRALNPVDRPVLARIREAPFLVIRAAGSLGFDLVALRSEFSFPIEVKSSSTDTIRFSAASGRASEQLEAHRAAVERVGLIVLYAYRRVGHRGGDPWRLYAAPGSSRPGSLNLLRRSLPPMDRTREGNAVLRWEDGLPLVRFLERIFFLTERPTGAAP